MTEGGVRRRGRGGRLDKERIQRHHMLAARLNDMAQDNPLCAVLGQGSMQMHVEPEGSGCREGQETREDSDRTRPSEAGVPLAVRRRGLAGSSVRRHGLGGLQGHPTVDVGRSADGGHALVENVVGDTAGDSYIVGRGGGGIAMADGASRGLGMR